MMALKPPQPRKALLLTVGTGNVERLNETFLIPLKKSIKEGEWAQVILLPSQGTAASAELLQNNLDADNIHISALPNKGDEDDADACFAHYNQVIGELIGQGFKPNDMVADFTRGTKAMSAALVLAASQNDIPHLRYVSGHKRDARGMVEPGNEIIYNISPVAISARKTMAAAERFMLQGNFSAVLEILPSMDNRFASLWPKDLLAAANTIKTCAKFYARWDRFDYRSAAATNSPSKTGSNNWDLFIPTDEVQQWVQTLSESMPDIFRMKAGRLRRLAADLLANGERRIRHRQFEDALLRAYRILELVGQLRLFECGLDSEDLPAENKAVKDLCEQLKKEQSAPLSHKKNGNYKAARENVARLLKRLDDPFGKKLLDFAKSGPLPAINRNRSILTHKFEAVSGDDQNTLLELYMNLEALFIEDGGHLMEDFLRLARSPDFQQYGH